uniref:hypothetical protein n=1 Tax=Flexithrix dorotheae TaxID=70993 RepID=UPI0005C71D9C
MTQSRSIALQGVDELRLLNYSEKSIALKGTDLEMGINKDFLWEKFNLWGTFNVRLKDQNGNKFSGWIFKKTDREKVKELVKFLEAGNRGDGKKRERSHSKKGREKHVKSPVSIDQHVVFLAWKKADDYDNQRKSFIHNPSFKTYLDDKHNLYIVSKYTQIDPWTGSEGKEVTGTLLVSKGGKTERLYDNDKKPDLKKFREIQIPLFIKVPREKKKPHYKL